MQTVRIRKPTWGTLEGCYSIVIDGWELSAAELQELLEVFLSMNCLLAHGKTVRAIDITRWTTNKGDLK